MMKVKTKTTPFTAYTRGSQTVRRGSQGRREILKKLFEMHLTQLNVHFAKYFTEDVDKFKLVKDPFNIEAL